MQVETIAEQLFFTTVRIDTLTNNGSDSFAGSGTGFFFNYKTGEEDCRFIVTNKHVIDGVSECRFSFLQRQDKYPILGQVFHLNVSPDSWFGHPLPDIDIAVCPFALHEMKIKQQGHIDLFYRCISNDMIPNNEQLEMIDAIESITFIGYPNGIWDSKNLLPVARRGTTASPIHIDFEKTPRFLIDASVFGGSSGSPVFILNQGLFTNKLGGTVIGSRILFVGVIAAVFFRSQFNEVIPVPIPTQTKLLVQQQEMIDLGIVFKAKTVIETIEAFLTSNIS